MKVVSISDTHGSLVEVPECEILTVSGDISPCDRRYNGAVAQRQYFFDVFLPFYTKFCKQLVFIAGNHDLFLYNMYKDNKEEQFRKTLPSNVIYLRDSWAQVYGVSMYGTPWTPEFCGWYFMDKDNDEGLGEKYKGIPESIEYLLSHGPPYGHGDVVLDVFRRDLQGKRLGSAMLMKRIAEAIPKCCVFGHIHTGDHNGSVFNETEFFNVSVLDEQYKVYQRGLVNNI